QSVYVLHHYYTPLITIQPTPLPLYLSFFFYCYVDHRDLHSFPTRRSSPFQIALNRFRAASQSISIRVVPPSSFSRSFVFLWFVAFLAYFSFQLTTGSLPLFALALGADDAAIGLLTGIIALASLVSRPW